MTISDENPGHHNLDQSHWFFQPHRQKPSVQYKNWSQHLVQNGVVPIDQHTVTKISVHWTVWTDAVVGTTIVLVQLLPFPRDMDFSIICPLRLAIADVTRGEPSIFFFGLYLFIYREGFCLKEKFTWIIEVSYRVGFVTHSVYSVVKNFSFEIHLYAFIDRFN